MAHATIGNATIVVEDTCLATQEGRPVFEWTVSLNSGEEWYAADLYGPVVGPEPGEDEMLRSFASFLAAALESRSYRYRTGFTGENEYLFPVQLLDWAELFENEISMLGIKD